MGWGGRDLSRPVGRDGSSVQGLSLIKLSRAAEVASGSSTYCFARVHVPLLVQRTQEPHICVWVCALVVIGTIQAATSLSSPPSKRRQFWLPFLASLDDYVSVRSCCVLSGGRGEANSSEDWACASVVSRVHMVLPACPCFTSAHVFFGLWWLVDDDSQALFGSTHAAAGHEPHATRAAPLA